MAPSRSATSMTWSVGTKRNAASLSTNFLISQGQATRSTLTCSRVIHFMSQVLLLLAGKRRSNTKETHKVRSFRLWHLAFFIHRDAATGQKDVEALPPGIVGRGVRPHFCGNLFLDRHTLRVHHVDDTRCLIDDAQVRDSNVEAAKLVIVPDGI